MNHHCTHKDGCAAEYHAVGCPGIRAAARKWFSSGGVDTPLQESWSQDRVDLLMDRLEDHETMLEQRVLHVLTEPDIDAATELEIKLYRDFIGQLTRFVDHDHSTPALMRIAKYCRIVLKCNEDPFDRGE